MTDKIYYGKGNVALYRSYANPLEGLTPIPESPYTGQTNGIFGVDLQVEVFGEVFRPAYTHGDNRMVVPTATMTNFALKKALDFEGSTLEDFLYFLSGEYLTQYPDMERVRLSVKELAYPAQLVAAENSTPDNPRFIDSDRLYAPDHNSYGYAMLEVTRNESGGVKILAHECGRHDMQLIKLTGSAFASFPRDSFTTLPDRVDRPLYIHLECGWRYSDAADAVHPGHANYIWHQHVHDHLSHTFHDFVNMSIQHLVHEMGVRLLNRFPQMGEVWFHAQNRLWDTAAESEGAKAKVYMDPRPPYGMIGLTLTRDDLE